MKDYKIWAMIEEHDPKAVTSDQEYQDLGEPACLGNFDTLAEAEHFLDSIDTYIYPRKRLTDKV